MNIEKQFSISQLRSVKEDSMKMLHLERESQSLINQCYLDDDFLDFESPNSFEVNEIPMKKQQSQIQYSINECMDQELQKQRSISTLEVKSKSKRFKNQKLTFKVDLNKMKNPNKQKFKAKNKNKSIFDDPEFSGIANTNINLYVLHKQGVIDEEINQWNKLQKQLDEINSKPDINKVLDSLKSKKFVRPSQDFKLEKHLQLPEYSQCELITRYKQNQTNEILDDDPEIDKYIEEAKQQILLKKQQIEENQNCQKSSEIASNQSQKDKLNHDSVFSSDDDKAGIDNLDYGNKKKVSNKKNEYILSEEEHKELFLLYCAKGYSPEGACQQARVPIKCAKRWICNLTPSRLTGGGRKIIDGMLEQKLRLWILLKLYKELKIPSRDQQIKYSLSQIRDNSFGCSKGWLEKYLDRNLLKFIVAHLRNLEIFRLEEVAKFFIVIPSVSSDLGQIQKEIKLVQNYQRQLELQKFQNQNSQGGQKAYDVGCKIKTEDIIIQPYVYDDQNQFFDKLLRKMYEKNLQNFDQRQNSTQKVTFINGNPQQRQSSQYTVPNRFIGQERLFQQGMKNKDQKNPFQPPDWSPYLQMIERANAMKQIQHYLTDNSNNKKIQIEDNLLMSVKAIIIEKIKKNSSISQITKNILENKHKFQEVQKLLEIQKQKDKKRQASQMQIEKTQNVQEVNNKTDLKQAQHKARKDIIESEEENEEDEFSSKHKNDINKFDEREFYIDTKKPLPSHIRKLLKISAINSISERCSQEPKNLEYYLKGRVFEIEAQNFFDVAVKTLNYKIESLISVFKFKF